MIKNANNPRNFAGRAPRIAMIGCGAIAERYHLPGLAKIPGVIENVLLVDRSSKRTQLMDDRFGVRRQAADISDVINESDGAIVAVPPAWHVQSVTGMTYNPLSRVYSLGSDVDVNYILHAVKQ